MKGIIFSLICAYLGMNIIGVEYNATDVAGAVIQYGIESENEFVSIQNLSSDEGELEEENGLSESQQLIEDKAESDNMQTIKETVEKPLYEKTMEINSFDKQVIENCDIDFSDIKITVMGDSITEGNILPEEEQATYCWPAQLRRILGCKEVVNLGKGGSVVSNCADNYPMCERWSDIESDSDIIIIMGGTNDMLFENRELFGNVENEQRKVEGTFCGDLDSMLENVYRVYVDENDDKVSRLIYINPPSTSKNDAVYMQDPDNMVKQEEFADAINTIALEHNFEVIDLYSNNLLNSHDPLIRKQYMIDEVHYNKEGCTVLAEHIASQIIQRMR